MSIGRYAPPSLVHRPDLTLNAPIPILQALTLSVSATSPIPLYRVGSEGTVSRSEALSFQQHLPGLSLGLLLGSVHFTLFSCHASSFLLLVLAPL